MLYKVVFYKEDRVHKRNLAQNAYYAEGNSLTEAYHNLNKDYGFDMKEEKRKEGFNALVVINCNSKEEVEITESL